MSKSNGLTWEAYLKLCERFDDVELCDSIRKSLGKNLSDKEIRFTLRIAARAGIPDPIDYVLRDGKDDPVTCRSFSNSGAQFVRETYKRVVSERYVESRLNKMSFSSIQKYALQKEKKLSKRAMDLAHRQTGL